MKRLAFLLLAISGSAFLNCSPEDSADVESSEAPPAVTTNQASPTCSGSQILSQGSCVESARTCAVANGTGTETFNTSSNSYGQCVVSTCVANYHIENSQCLSNTRTCSVTGGSGTQIWQTGGGYGLCENITCVAPYFKFAAACVTTVSIYARFTESHVSFTSFNNSGIVSRNGTLVFGPSPAGFQQYVRITFSSPLPDTNYAVITNGSVRAKTTSYVEVYGYYYGDTGTLTNTVEVTVNY